jgi:hypothetical protein
MRRAKASVPARVLPVSHFEQKADIVKSGRCGVPSFAIDDTSAILVGLMNGKSAGLGLEGNGQRSLSSLIYVADVRDLLSLASVRCQASLARPSS